MIFVDVILGGKKGPLLLAKITSNGTKYETLLEVILCLGGKVVNKAKSLHYFGFVGNSLGAKRLCGFHDVPNPNCRSNV